MQNFKIVNSHNALILYLKKYYVKWAKCYFKLNLNFTIHNTQHVWYSNQLYSPGNWDCKKIIVCNSRNVCNSSYTIFIIKLLYNHVTFTSTHTEGNSLF